MKSITKSILIVSIIIALTTITLGITYKLNTLFIFTITLFCSIVLLVTFYISKDRLLKTDQIILFELKTKRKVQSKKTKKLINIISLVPMTIVFYFVFYSELNNYLVFAYVIAHLIFIFVFLVPRTLTINSNEIKYIPFWKIKWTELKSYQFVENDKILLLEKLDGKEIQIGEIKREDLNDLKDLFYKNFDRKVL